MLNGIFLLFIDQLASPKRVPLLSSILNSLRLILELLYSAFAQIFLYLYPPRFTSFALITTIAEVVERLSATTPNLSKGYYDVDVESVIRPGDFTTDQRPCGPLSGVTIGNYFTPMIPKLKEEVQDSNHIIPEDSKMDWVRGGLPTRQIVRNADYLRRCQEKTV